MSSTSPNFFLYLFVKIWNYYEFLEKGEENSYQMQNNLLKLKNLSHNHIL